ncbi:MAG: PAS domain S-box protein, partial [Sulfuricella sp.]
FIATDTVQIGQQTFTVVVERSAAMTAIPALTGMKIVGAVTILALGLALALFYRLVRQIIPPIQEVTSAARAIRNGDIERRVNLTSDDEVGELASAFNSMTARLRATLGELELEVRERMSREMELRKLNKSYVALSMSNHAVIHASDETELLQKICSIVVDVCEYRLAWIGLTEHDSGKNVRPIAHAGHDEDHLDTLNITWADTERGRGPTGRAIRERRAVVIHDLDNDPAFAPWRDQALELGYACCAAVPLISGQQVFGGLTVYGVAPSRFVEDELQLLSELADNVAYGIAALRAENARKAALDEIREERDFSQAILNTAGSIIVVLDTNGRIKRFNRTAETLTGYSFAEVAEKPFWEIFLLDEELETIKGVFDCLGTGNIESRHENHWRMRDGSTRLFDWSKTLKFDELGNVAYIVAIGVDITKRKIAEAALRESEQSLRTMADFTYDWEYWQGPDREIWYITPSCERITGYSREEFLADPELISQIVHPEDRPLWDLHAKEETHDDIASLDFRIVHKDGTIRWLAHGCHAVYWGSGKFMGRRASVRDITDRKSIEEGWKRTSHLLRELAEHHENVREEERTRVAREIHDELGQLLTALRMEVSLCRIKHGGSNPDLMERITSMQNLLSMTIDSVRVITKNLRPVALDLGIIAGIDWLAQEFHQHTGIPCQSELDTHLILDEKQSLVLFRVMQESLTNIAKHANALQVKLSLFHEGNFVVAVVRDNGTGFNKETLRSTKSFGLLGMHERLMMVCGELRVYSTLGKGTTILVHLPVASPNNAANTICCSKHALEPLRH